MNNDMTADLAKAGLHVAQSHRLDWLFDQLQHFCETHPVTPFERRYILVPSYGVGIWLKQQFAEADGICANVITTFPGSMQWRIYSSFLDETGNTGNTLDTTSDQDDAAFSVSQLRWRLFDYLLQAYDAAQQQAGTTGQPWLEVRPADAALVPLFNALKMPSPLLSVADGQHDIHRQLWQLSEQAARVYAGYATYRPHWMRQWSAGKPIDIEKIIERHQQNHPNYEPPTKSQLDRARQVETWQMAIWQAVMADAFLEREQQITEFWQRIKAEPERRQARLPRSLAIFTLNQLPPAELAFYRELSRYIPIQLLHYNPSAEYWADLVDPDWAKRNALKTGKWQHYDTAPRLLARLGGQARDVFFQLTELSGNQYGEWIDHFAASDMQEPEPLAATDTVLGQLQHEILTLQEEPVWQCQPDDDSLVIHGCHSLTRQLEVLHDELKQWFAADRSRQPADVLVLVPDLHEAAPAIRAVFQIDEARLLRQDKEQGHELIPAIITGIAQPEAENLWHALRQLADLLHGRFTIEQLMDWLGLDVVQRSLALSPEQVQRAIELLTLAGFRRGFNEQHLRQTLLDADQDVRFTLDYALRRLTLGWFMPLADDQLRQFHGVTPVGPLGSGDAEIIARLLDMRRKLQEVAQQSIQLMSQQADRQALAGQPGSTAQRLVRPLTAWLDWLRSLLQNHFQQESGKAAWEALETAFDQMRQYHQQAPDYANGGLPLSFVLDELQQMVEQAPPGSRPGGGVTFSRLGTLRPLPYRLICLLNLNPQQMPVKDSRSMLDLIAILPYQSGDRSRTADHRGSFLDALLLAQDGCWLFYDAINPLSQKPQLPAAPLQLIIDQLKSKLPQPEAPADTIMAQATDGVPTVAHWQQLIRLHTLQPFELDNFDPVTPRSGSAAWQQVAARLQQPAQVQAPLWQLPASRQLPALQIRAGRWPLSLLTRQLTHPAQTFIREKRLNAPYLQEELTTREALTLDRLAEYQVNSGKDLPDPDLSDEQALALLRQHPSYDQLPVGAAGLAYWRRQATMQQEQAARVHAIDPAGLTPVKEYLLPLDPDRIMPLTVSAPQQLDCALWVQSTFSKQGDDKLLRYWLPHLAWQVLRQTTAQQAEADEGCSIIVYRDTNETLHPVESAAALLLLREWVAVWQASQEVPWVFPVTLMLSYCRSLQAQKPEENLWEGKVITEWQKTDNGYNGGLAAHERVDRAVHPDWQLLLQGQDTAGLLDWYWQRDGERLLLPLLAAVSQPLLMSDPVMQQRLSIPDPAVSLPSDQPQTV